MCSLPALISTLALCNVCNGIAVTYNIRDHRNIDFAPWGSSKDTFQLALTRNDNFRMYGNDITYGKATSTAKLIKGLSPMFISCKLDDIAIISAPVVNCNEIAYYLYKPNGDSVQLELRGLNTEEEYGLTETGSSSIYSSKDTIVENINEYVNATYSLRYTTLKVNNNPTIINFQEMEEIMSEYDLMIGPLLEEDHGKWVLVIYCKDRDKQWIKLFQLITVNIIEDVPMKQPDAYVKEGNTINLNFAYSVKGIETCSLVPPNSLDRYYERNRLIEPEKCGYVIPNISNHDAGTWKLTGVGRIVYETNTKEELPPIFIPCGLNAVVIISAPVANLEVAYYLYKPNGDGIQLDLPRPNTDKEKFEAKHAFTEKNFAEYALENSTDIIVQNINEYVTMIYPKRIFKVLPSYLMSKGTIERDTVKDDSIENAEKSMAEYDFMIGPLLEEDHGNWVLSAYCRGRENEWIEIFQVITIAIIARVPMDQDEVALKEGSTFNLSFAYSLKGIEACSLAPPESTLDRYYDRNRLLEPDKCGYTVPNVTTHDAGVWKITGVGPIVYEGYVVLYNKRRRQEKLNHSFL